VEARTSRSLRELGHLDEDIAVGLALQRLAAPEFAAERRGIHS
jgi:hypothetical protein